VRPGDVEAARPASEEPEHRGDRRRFLIWAAMLGIVPPERVVERVIADVNVGEMR
jgi:hypothetical protein